MKNERKLIVLGLDGATFDLIIPWINEGKLRTMKRLMEKGTWGELESTKPPLTCPAWPSFITGKNAGKHGIADFIIETEDGERVVNFKDIKSEPFWDTAGKHGLKSIVVNVPITYPPRIVNGILVSGMMAPPRQPWCSSSQVMNEIDQAVGGYMVDLDILTINSLSQKKSLQKLYEMMEKRHKAVMYLKGRYPYNLLVCVFKASDIISHKLWNKQDEILGVYQKIDQYIENFIDQDANLFIMSDHGFGGFSKGIRINQYLFELGFIKKRKATAEDGFTHGFTSIQKLRFGADTGYKIIQFMERSLLSIGITRANVREALSRMGLLRFATKHFPKLIKRMIPAATHTVDRDESKAFLHSTRTRSITINKKGFSNESDYENCPDYLIQRLLDLKDDEYGKKVISKVFKKNEIYHGKFAEQLPDLYIVPEDGYLIRGDFGKEIIHRFPVSRPDHCATGIFIGYGPDITKEAHIVGTKIEDLAPTFLHLLNLPIPKDVDGGVLKELFEEESEAYKREEKYFTPEKIPEGDEILLSGAEEKAMRDTLRGLGYL